MSNNVEHCNTTAETHGHISAYETAAYFILPLLLVWAGVMPSTAIFAMFAALPLLYLLYRRFGIYFPSVCVIVYGILSLTLNYDILSVLYSVTLLFTLGGIAMGVQFAYLPSVAVCVGLSIAGAFLSVGIVRVAEETSIGNVASRYVICEYDDPFIGLLARDYYDGSEPAPGTEKIKRGQPGYDEAVKKDFADYVKDDFSQYIWYDCIHVAALLALVGFFAANVINGRTSGKQSLVGGHSFSSTTPVADMKLPRAFLWTFAAPATVTGFILGFVGGYDALAATVMHAFVTIPCAFGCFTLFAFFVSLFRGKARVAARMLLGMIGVAALLFPLALFIMSVLGVCDCILNIRFWTNYIKES